MLDLPIIYQSINQSITLSLSQPSPYISRELFGTFISTRNFLIIYGKVEIAQKIFFITMNEIGNLCFISPGISKQFLSHSGVRE
jgi:hypothetical protein